MDRGVKLDLNNTYAFQQHIARICTERGGWREREGGERGRAEREGGRR